MVQGAPGVSRQSGVPLSRCPLSLLAAEVGYSQLAHFSLSSYSFLPSPTHGLLAPGVVAEHLVKQLMSRSMLAATRLHSPLLM